MVLLLGITLSLIPLGGDVLSYQPSPITISKQCGTAWFGLKRVMTILVTPPFGGPNVFVETLLAE